MGNETFRMKTSHRISYFYLILPWVVMAMVFLGLQIDQRLAERAEGETRMFLEEEGNLLAGEVNHQLVKMMLVTGGIAATVAAGESTLDSDLDQIARLVAGKAEYIHNISFAPDFVVSSVHPVEESEMVLGFDLRSRPEVLASVDHAIKDRTIVVDGPHIREDGERVVVSRAPVFVDGQAVEDLWGMVNVEVSLDSIIADSGLLKPRETYDIALRSASPIPGTDGMIWGSSEIFETSPIVVPTGHPIGNWELAVTPKDGWAMVYQDRPVLILIYGAACACLLALIGVGFWQARQRLVAESVLTSAIDTIDDGFAIYDADDRLVAFNSEFAEQYSVVSDLIVRGVRFETLVREAVRRGLFPEAIGCEEEWIQMRLEMHKSGEGEFIHRLSDGRWTKVAERVMDNGWRVGFRVDITEMREAREEAERANKAKSEFISILSHELRTPLTIILGYTRVLENLKLFKSTQAIRKTLAEENPSVEDIREQFENLLTQVSTQASKMHASGEHLLVLINDMLDVSKIEAGKMELFMKDVALGSMIHSVVENMHESATEKGITLSAEADHIQIEADEVRVKQVLINLIGNAIKFTDEGGIAVRCFEGDDTVTIEIEDSGCGISEDRQESIFEAFRQADNSDVRRAGGTGLGLAISLQIVKMHGGMIGVESIPDKGSVFTVTLPKSQGEDDAADETTRVELIEASDDYRKSA